MSLTYQNVIFDLYGTLVDIKTDESLPLLWQELARYYRSYGATYEADELKRAYQEAWHLALRQKQIETGYTYPEANVVAVFKQLYEVKASRAIGEDWAVGVAKRFRQLSCHSLGLHPQAIEVLTALKARGYQLYLLSNAQALFANAELDTLGLRPYFDGIYFSSDYQMRKPQMEFLLQLLDDQALDEDDTVFVGNSPESDMVIARCLGIDGMCLGAKDGETPSSYAHLNQLSDLLT